MAKRRRDKSSWTKSRIAGFPLVILLIGFLYSMVTEPAFAAAHSRYAGCPKLHIDSTGPCVKLLQAQLDKDQFKPHLQIDGSYLDQTRRAVENFQRAAGIPVDGIVGARTYNALIHYRSDVKIPPHETSGLGHFADSVWGAICTYARTPYVIVPAITGVVMLIALGMVLRHARRPDVKSLHLEVGRRGIKLYTDTHTPQRIIQSQSETLKHIYASRPPNELPAPDNAIRSIEGDGWQA